MKKIIKAALAAALTAGLFGLAACKKTEAPRTTTGNKAPAAQAVYTCPMHPEVIQNTPGKCPKCGMDLVEKQG